MTSADTMEQPRYSSIQRMRLIHRLARFVVVLAIGCGSPRSPLDGPSLSGWEAQMLGAKPDAYFVLRTDKALADPVYGGPRTPFDPPPTEQDPELEAFVRSSKLAGKDGDAKMGLVGGGLVVRSSKSGDMELTATFSDEAHAERAAATVVALAALVPTLRHELANQCPAWEKVEVDLHRDGKTVTGRMSNLPPLVRAYRLGACRYQDAKRVAQ